MKQVCHLLLKYCHAVGYGSLTDITFVDKDCSLLSTDARPDKLFSSIILFRYSTFFSILIEAVIDTTYIIPVPYNVLKAHNDSRDYWKLVYYSYTPRSEVIVVHWCLEALVTNNKKL